ncbi:uncharacterized protein LOC131680882 [Topomyia yanbarensis]|uniref:uncharacterized protein LOC131680882 n=1 Tax=Topomyia yanbarensis TaxID=2498891 RepID=UPI00273CC3C9|nr:uncharacterized protein LOC131680882 [Topomyia yanbarensis]
MTFHTSSGSPEKLIHRVTVPRFLNFVRLILLQLVVAVVYGRLPLDSHSRGSYILDIGPRLIMVWTSCSMLVVTLLDAVNYRSSIEIFKKIHAIDGWFQRLKANPEHSLHQNAIIRALVILLLISVVLHSVTFAFFVVEIGHVGSVLLLTTCGLVFNTSFTLIFCSYLVRSYLIGTRFELVNRIISLRFVTSNRRRFIWTKELVLNRSNELELVSKLADIHAGLADIVDLLGETQWFQTILLSVNVIGFTTFNIFSSLRAVFSGERYLLFMSTQTTLWSLFYLVLFIALIFRSFLLGSEAKRTAVLIYKVLNNTKDERLLMILRYFARQIQDRPVEVRFKAYDGNLPVLLSAMGTIGTYLVILIQFDGMTLAKEIPGSE